MPNKHPCPCGSGQDYPNCCGRFIDGNMLPETAEALMRSRYTAYALKNADYLRETWHPVTRRQELGLDEPVKWLDLKILSIEDGGPNDRVGRVEFIARYTINGRAHRLHENSRFQRHGGRWLYVDGAIS